MLLLREVNGGLTLLGIYETYKSKMPEIYGWNSETAQTYDRNYYEVLAPKFYKKAFVEYTIDDIISILDEIQNEGYIEEGKKKKYSDSQIRTFKSNIRRIDDIAVRNKIRLGSVFYGSIFELDDYKVGKEKNFYTNVEKITQKNLNENTVLKKSLTEEEEEKVFKSVMCDYKQIGDNMGIALMYACGLRNAEACGVNFGDIIAIDENEDSFVVRIKGTTNSSREETLQTKTENAYRYIPLSEKTFNLLINRKEYVKSKLNMANIAAILFFINNRPFLSNTIYQEPFSKSRPNSNKDYLIVRLWNFQSAPWYASFDNLTGTISIVILLAFLRDTPPILENLILVELTVLLVLTAFLSIKAKRKV